MTLVKFRVEKISEMNLEVGNIENAKEMACVFNKLFSLTVIVDTNTDSSLAMDLVTRASMILLEQVAREFKSSSSAIRAID